ncbi:MAG TPA: hypothetical protein VF440_07790 [Novosphingobium sp.]
MPGARSPDNLALAESLDFAQAHHAYRYQASPDVFGKVVIELG